MMFSDTRARVVVALDPKIMAAVHLHSPDTVGAMQMASSNPAFAKEDTHLLSQTLNGIPKGEHAAQTDAPSHANGISPKNNGQGR